jgi:lauroyl/myristoyl acyltransferase
MAQQSGHGVICVHHHAWFTRSFWTWLAIQNMDPGVTIRIIQQGTKIGQAERAVENARQLWVAMECLQRNGLVHILPDGFQGQRVLILPFYNKLRPFEPGFAELALLTGAEIVPVATMMDRTSKSRSWYTSTSNTCSNSGGISRRMFSMDITIWQTT